MKTRTLHTNTLYLHPSLIHPCFTHSYKTYLLFFGIEIVAFNSSGVFFLMAGRGSSSSNTDRNFLVNTRTVVFRLVFSSSSSSFPGLLEFNCDGLLSPVNLASAFSELSSLLSVLFLSLCTESVEILECFLSLDEESFLELLCDFELSFLSELLCRCLSLSFSLSLSLSLSLSFSLSRSFSLSLSFSRSLSFFLFLFSLSVKRERKQKKCYS